MSHLVADCPRCRAQKMTFNVTADSPLRHLGGYYYYEAFCICRECNNATIFELRSTSAFSKGRPSRTAYRRRPIYHSRLRKCRRFQHNAYARALSI